MKGILFRDDVWDAKMRVLEQYGEAQTRRNGGSLKKINMEPEKWNLIATFDDGNLFRFGSEVLNRDLTIKPPYKLGEVVYRKELWYGEKPAPYKSPMMMAEKYARSFIQIKEVRCELVRDITEEDARAEGIDIKTFRVKNMADDLRFTQAIFAYKQLYDSINGDGRFDIDWCFAYTFKLVMRK